MTDGREAIDRETKAAEEMSRRHAAEHGEALNPDPKYLEMLFGALARRKVKFGEFYCPCRVVTGDPAKDKPSICPCEPHAKEVAEHGHCLCKLFFRPDSV